MLVSNEAANRQNARVTACNAFNDAVEEPCLCDGVGLRRQWWLRGVVQSMEWIELKRSSPIRIHEPLILIQSNPADGPEYDSSPVQSGHNRVGIYQIPCKIDI